MDIVEHFDCDCGEFSHGIRFSLYKWKDEYPEINVEFYLENYQSWHKRLWEAVKYVFGYKINCFSDFIMKKEDVPRFEKLIKEYKKSLEEYDEHIKENK